MALHKDFPKYLVWSGRQDLPAVFARVRLAHGAGPPQSLRKSSMIFCPVLSTPVGRGQHRSRLRFKSCAVSTTQTKKGKS